nr:PREDICTED: ripening-related protein grip22-like [Daucus carota subsp. sativus]
MASLVFPYLVFLVTAINSLLLASAESDCNGTCTTLDDCSGQLICINSKCNDDPDVGTSICKGGSAAPGPLPLGPSSNCYSTCSTLNDCSGPLICVNRKCNDDPDVGTNICEGRGSAAPPSQSRGYQKKPTVGVALFVNICLLILYIVD